MECNETHCYFCKSSQSSGLYFNHVPKCYRDACIKNNILPLCTCNTCKGVKSHEGDSLQDISSVSFARKRSANNLEEEPKMKQRKLPIASGKITDPDSLIIIFSYLAPSTLAKCREICKWWHEIASSNVLWKALFERYLWSAHQHINEDGKDSQFWFHQYSSILLKIPRYISGESAAFYSEGGGNSDYHSMESFHFYSVKCARELVTSEVHQLAVVMAILGCNGYCPHPEDDVRIGTEDNDMKIPLSKFCYAILTKQASELYSLPTEDGTNSIGISPDIEGTFTPFLYYLKMEGRESTLRFASAQSSKSKNLIEFGPLEGIFGCIYKWRTPEEYGWAPQYFNASHPWYYENFMNMKTVYNYLTRQIIITEVSSTERQW